MRFEKVRDILEHAQEFHNQASEYYERLSSLANNKRIKLILNYLSEHEKNLAKGMENYLNEAPKQILNTWFQYTDDDNKLNALKECKPPSSEITTDEIIDLALKIDDCLISFFTDVAENSETDDVSEMLRGLLALEVKEKHNFVRNIMMMQDV